jgi:hypothetical protein
VIEILNLKINQDLSSAGFSKQQILEKLLPWWGERNCSKILKVVECTK